MVDGGWNKKDTPTGEVRWFKEHGSDEPPRLQQAWWHWHTRYENGTQVGVCEWRDVPTFTPPVEGSST